MLVQSRTANVGERVRGSSEPANDRALAVSACNVPARRRENVGHVARDVELAQAVSTAFASEGEVVA